MCVRYGWMCRLLPRIEASHAGHAKHEEWKQMEMYTIIFAWFGRAFRTSLDFSVKDVLYSGSASPCTFRFFTVNEVSLSPSNPGEMYLRHGMNYSRTILPPHPPQRWPHESDDCSPSIAFESRLYHQLYVFNALRVFDFQRLVPFALPVRDTWPIIYSLVPLSQKESKLVRQAENGLKKNE